jgi:hypothetical protein
MERGFQGWVCYLDADAYVSDLDFDLRKYLTDKSDVALIAAYGGKTEYWSVNAGVLLFNLSHPVARSILYEWHRSFEQITDDQLLSMRKWEDGPEDQQLLQNVLKTLPYAEKHFLIERSQPYLMNYRGRFIRQVLRVEGNLEERKKRLAAEVDEVMGHAQTP